MENTNKDLHGEPRNILTRRFYLIIVVCVVVTFFMGYVVNMRNLQQSQMTATSVSVTPAASSINTYGIDDSVVVSSQADIVSATEAINAEGAEEAGFVAPIVGDVITPYSAGDLVYDATMDDWRVHSGVDIKSELGAEVKSVAKGTIEKITTDELYGTVIIIGYDNGFVGKYYNVDNFAGLREGDVVGKGDIIGKVSEVATFESGLAPHLHFELWKDGAATNPGNYVGAN
ncbi:MAG: M23 family metallopeptidase [Clostridiales bacterium]|nr:M23 family metallopeptidase [Clostridiales bacterium]